MVDTHPFHASLRKTARRLPRRRLDYVPIRSIRSRERKHIVEHLQRLEPHDRYLRFGYAATDEQIQRYVEGLDFERDEIFGIYNRRLHLIAVAHLAFALDPEYASCAEFGVSVQAEARGRGYGKRLFEHAVMHARNQGVGMLFIHALTENTVMLGIAHKAGARVQRDGSESEAHLMLPPATLDSRVSELVERHFAEANYAIKHQAKRFHDFLKRLQQARRSGQDAPPVP